MKALKDLWFGLTHNADGTFSSTKFYQNVGYITATIIVLKLAWTGNLGSEVFLVYVGAITAARSFQNYLAAKGKQVESERWSHHPGSKRAEDLE